MSAVDQRAEAHRLKTELNYGTRRIAKELGISRWAATQLLAQPLPQPVADEVAGVAGQSRPVAEPLAGPDGQMAGVARPPEPSAPAPTAPVRRVVGVAGLTVRPPAAARPDDPGPWLRVSLARRPGLLRTLMRLVRLGLQIPEVVDLAVSAFAAGYHHALTHGQVTPGQMYEVQTVIRPCRHQAA
ncbi:hypothetical protein [Streptomyces ipomoeae]|uniref:hypothetical protein n=1 Tax=Streptomyces ipomoeae TaxID=103232 RepID=UPI001147050B|nr:hypothetical protein [Streptomyces ipomoeae]TQE35453.1 hypothetical protein Sipo7851_14420 [Streptomyces ipomoeae]